MLRLRLRRTGVIVAFHRINERTVADGLTCSPREYERFCRFFRDHFEVVPLGEMVWRLEAGRSLEGLLAITHDDGYLDNFEHAAPILSRLGLPGTFFVTTRFLGSDFVPWWDRETREKLGWMSWDQVRELRAQGFEIGSHTTRHVDLGVASEREALRELQESRRDLERELGESVDLFAYPYGADVNMSDQNRKLVRESGYRCCLSCDGGIVRDGSDPFALPRVPVSSWYRSPWQLAFDLALGRA